MSIRTACSSAILLPLLALAGCDSGNEAGSEGGNMFVQSCSLGCNNGQDGLQVFCAIVNAHQNQEVSATFSQPVDLFTVDASTFRVVDVQNGTTPLGDFLLDPLNPRRLIFRPALNFDPLSGNPEFGFDPDRSYLVEIPGENQDSPPYVRSGEGRPNLSRMTCTIRTDLGIIDPVPGDPDVRVLVDVVAAVDANGNPTALSVDQEVEEGTVLEDVWRSSRITFLFNDIMNPATLVNPSSGIAPFVSVESDGDGNKATTADRTVVPGIFSVVVDEARLETTMTFIPAIGYPSSGSDPNGDPLRPILITIRDNVVDLAGHPVTPPGEEELLLAFFPEQLDFDPIAIIEDFTIPGGQPGSREDVTRTGAEWGGVISPLGIVGLKPGTGGGSGRLGDLHIKSGETVVLNTETQDFPLPGRNSDLLGQGLPPGLSCMDEVSVPAPSQITINDGGFEFTSVVIENGGRLVFEGANPARVFSRGRAGLANGGVIDVSGSTPPAHDSRIALPSDGKNIFRDDEGTFMIEDVPMSRGAGGPAAGDGGFGADRFDHEMNQNLIDLFDADADDRSDALVIASFGYTPDTDGDEGDGVGGGPASDGGGIGGSMSPGGYPIETVGAMGSGKATENAVSSSELNFNDILDGADDVCLCRQVAGPGSGGGYASNGTEGMGASTEPVAIWFEFGPSNNPANPTPPGLTIQDLIDEPPDDENTDYDVRTLCFEAGHLRGGSGGGGAGNHPYDTRADGLDGADLFACIGPDSDFSVWHDHSGAPGGGGGGAFQLVSGRVADVQGIIDASGGNGGSAVTDFDFGVGRFAMPGGAGSGGAVRIQAPSVFLGPSAGRIDVSGGQGGSAFFAPATFGGDGGAGLVRIEDSASSPLVEPGDLRAAYAPSILPVGPSDSVDWVSAAPRGWLPEPDVPQETFSAAASCWIRPEGLFFQLNFQEDLGPTSIEQGWNMDVIYQPGAVPILIPFRGDDVTNPFPCSFEKLFGNEINYDPNPGPGSPNPGSPIAVRFQGAQLLDDVSDLCDLGADGPEIVPGSVTPWVVHPAELNDFLPPPNIVRFTIVFDRSARFTIVERVKGVTNLVIKARPD